MPLRSLIVLGMIHTTSFLTLRAGEVGERFGCSAADSVHQQSVRGGCLRWCAVDSTNGSLGAF